MPLADLPAIFSDDLPAGDLFWTKIKQDLNFGYKIHGSPPYFTEVIRVYTQKPDSDWKFLIIATASNLNLKVYALELHAFQTTKESWKLNLRHHPIPKPQWHHQWLHYIENYPQEQAPTADTQHQIISHYLSSIVDFPNTQSAFNRITYPKNKISWVTPTQN